MTNEPPSGREQTGLDPGQGSPDGGSEESTSGVDQRQVEGGADPGKRPTSVRDAVAGRRQEQGNRGRRGRGRGRGRRGRDRPAPADPRAHDPSEPDQTPASIQPPEPVEREIDIEGRVWRAVSDGASVAASSVPLLSVRFEAPPGGSKSVV